jgi:hypothetical protein
MTMASCCENCKYCIVDNEMKEEWENGEWVKKIKRSYHACHRYAPRMINGAGTGWAEWTWPEVDRKDWCGEYVAIS